ncbi:vWA domain-containing protein [Thiosocius teredinicola]|uniref:vWA domain-containing protein n=1 Tax=Thiosocius teredinicola TaxID=1973002 RepID=UPI000990EBD6
MKVLRTLIATLTLSAALLGCSQQESLTVLAGSELKDIEPRLDEIASATGVRLEMHYIGTLDGADAIVNGNQHYDFAWFSHAKYLSLLQGPEKRIVAEEKIGLSPVIPAVKESLARKWGWTEGDTVTWADIAEKAKSGEFRFAMTDPTASNSGFSTVMGVQAAFSGSSDVITADNVDVAKLKDFFSGQALTSGSSGWLAEAYVREQEHIDGLFNYESILMDLNTSGKLREELVLIYPQEGVVTADYPFILLNKDQREAYNKIVAYLKTPDFQQWMMENTNRRPVLPQIKATAKFPKGFQLELPFPSGLNTVNEILFAFLDQHRKPNHSIFVLDVSGSMAGDRLEQLKRALYNLTGDDKSLTGRFARFRNRERITLIAFNSGISMDSTYEMTADGANISDVRHAINDLQAGGNTAIYDAMSQAYELAMTSKQQDPQRFYSIVLMTDGNNTAGTDYQQFASIYYNHANAAEGIRTFPILFGDSNDAEMMDLATMTGGRVFDSRKQSLAQAFKKIRGYQ